MLDTIVYEFLYLDRHKASISANTIFENIFSQVDEEGNRFVLFEDLVNHRVDVTDTMQQDSFIILNNAGMRQRETNIGWNVIIQWKDGSTPLEIKKDVKECYTIQITNYYHKIRISQEPAFAWWVPHVRGIDLFYLKT